MPLKRKVAQGPSWLEVGLGAALSVVLGVVLGAAYLVSKPVQKVTAIPKDAPSGAVYYIEGSRDFSRGGAIDQKRKSLVAGQSVELDEGELNAFLAEARPSAPAAPAKPGAKAGDKPPPADKLLDTSALNARIKDGRIQFADTATVSLFGASAQLVVQATGVFARHGSEIEFDPDVIYVGGCPVQRFLVVRSLILKTLLFNAPVPADLAAAWAKLSDVTIEGSTLHLKMP